MHLFVEPLEAFESVGLAHALVVADAFEARDAQRVAGAVARGLLYVLKVNLDNRLRLDLNVSAPGRDDAGFEPRGQFAQRLFRKTRADLADRLQLFSVADGDDEG